MDRSSEAPTIRLNQNKETSNSNKSNFISTTTILTPSNITSKHQINSLLFPLFHHLQHIHSHSHSPILESIEMTADSEISIPLEESLPRIQLFIHIENRIQQLDGEVIELGSGGDCDCDCFFHCLTAQYPQFNYNIKRK